MITTSMIGAAAALGFFGSMHCAFMCGPLAAAACGDPARGDRDGGGAQRTLLYLGGRLTVYALFGAAFGALGEHLACHFPLDVAQRAALVLVAGLALARGVRLLMPARRTDLVALRRPSALTRVARFTQVARFKSAVTQTARFTSAVTQAARFIASVVPRRALPLGLATGVLPCGMLMSAWALAASTGRPSLGALSMAVFSLASAPALIGSILAARRVARTSWMASPHIQGLAWCALALWIGLRPLLHHAGHAGH